MIGAGEVYVNDQVADKPGMIFSSDITIRLKEKCAYVSRGGLKLQAALRAFELDVGGLVALERKKTDPLFPEPPALLDLGPTWSRRMADAGATARGDRP